MLASRQRGDTIIEVILGLAILGLVTVSMFAIMQRGAANAYDALERSQARQLLNTQAELLNYVRDSYAASKAIGVIPADNSPGKVWQKITDQSPTAVVKNTQSIALPTLSTCAPTADDTDFYLTKSAGVIGMETDFTAATGAPTPGKGIWIQRADPQGSPPPRNFHDFYILACWSTTMSNTQTLSTIVRLYDQD